MGISPSTMCCPKEDASHRPKEDQSGHGSGASPCCPAAPLEPIKPEPLLSRVHLLVGCESVEEHNRRVKHALHILEDLHGSEGLRALGLEYRQFRCMEHQGLLSKNVSSASLSGDISIPLEQEMTATDSAPRANALKSRTTTADTEPGSEESSSSTLPTTAPQTPIAPLLSPLEHLDANTSVDATSNQGAEEGGNDEEQVGASYTMPVKCENSNDKDDFRSTSSEIGTGDHLTVAESLWESLTPESFHFCLNCRRRLVHIESGTILDKDNRADFIADGIMYERVAEVCQEVAQEAMCEDYDLEWKRVAPSSHNGTRAEIRALVSKPADNDNERTGTIIIVTGRGVVRAGIFSRQALVCGEGLEAGSAWHLLREASLRRMKVLMPDPNCRGDRWGYDVIRQSLRELWPEDKDEDVYMVIHSAGGSNVQRFLLDTPGSAQTHLPQIKAMALTDSTHNLQWSRREPAWHDFWESERVIYLKSAQTMRDADGSRWYLHAAGTPIQTDSFWKHRFGEVQTCNAGTDIHAMTNWFAHQPIWKHLDHFWKLQRQDAHSAELYPLNRRHDSERGGKPINQDSQ